MKILATSVLFLFSTLLFGQAQPPVNVTPGAPAVNSPAGTAASPAAATPPAPLPPDTVVAEVNGKKYTATEVDKLIAMLPPQYQQAARSQPQLLGQVFLMQRLAEDAEKAGLDQKAPLKEQLEIQRLQLLSTAELTDVNNTMKVTEEDEQKYYKEHPDKFKAVKVRVIYIAFTPTPAKAAADGKTAVTEAEAKAKIEDLAKQIQGGADFGKLAHDVSDDKASAAKDGDFGVIKQDSTFPPAIKTAVFALKQGEVSAPIREPNGFYLIRAEEISEQSFNESLVQVSQATRQAKFQEWLKGMQAQYSVKIENPAYFTPRAPAPLPQPH
jgi:peptidyl-prolyl cis-trans isomerase C